MDDFDPASLTDEQLAAVLEYVGRQNSARRTRADRHCQTCGKLLENVVGKRRYCGAACLMRARYWKQKAETTDDPTAPFKTRFGERGW